MTPSSPWVRMFNLRKDQDEPESIDANIQQGVNAAGANLWVLIFAIMIASIGLNVNSTAVIIGAMLISPLMGPIVGIGYGAGIADFELIRRAARNLAMMTAISLTTATLYFALSPLHSAHSELLARTTPTIWDVLIAFFGGAAGIVATTRKSISNAIPGVAIATALMPPLCTTGFGIANGNWAFAAGAFYLFTINGVFIALATLFFVKIMRLPAKVALEGKVAFRQRLLVAAVAGLTLIPSAILAIRLVQAERFQADVRSVLSDYGDDSRFVLLASRIDGKARSVKLVVSGDVETDQLQRELAVRLAAHGIADANIGIRHAGRTSGNLASIENLVRDKAYADQDRHFEEMRNRVVALEMENESLRARQVMEKSVLAEVAAQFSDAERVDVATGRMLAAADGSSSAVMLIHIVGSEPMSAGEQERLVAGWRSRFPEYWVQLDQRPAETPGDTSSERTLPADRSQSARAP